MVYQDTPGLESFPLVCAAFQVLAMGGLLKSSSRRHTTATMALEERDRAVL